MGGTAFEGPQAKPARIAEAVENLRIFGICPGIPGEFWGEFGELENSGILGKPYLSSTFGPGFLGLSGRSSSHSIRSIKASSPMGLPIRSCLLKSTISIPCFSHCNQVNMVRHKTIDPDLYPVLCTPLRHQLQVRLVLPIIKNVCWRRLPRRVTCCGISGATTFAIRAI